MIRYRSINESRKYKINQSKYLYYQNKEEHISIESSQPLKYKFT